MVRVTFLDRYPSPIRVHDISALPLPQGEAREARVECLENGRQSACPHSPSRRHADDNVTAEERRGSRGHADARIAVRAGVDFVSVGDSVGVNCGFTTILCTVRWTKCSPSASVRRASRERWVLRLAYGPVQNSPAAVRAATRRARGRRRLVSSTPPPTIPSRCALVYPASVSPVRAHPQTAAKFGIPYSARIRPARRRPQALRLVAEAKLLEARRRMPIHATPAR